MEFSISSRTAGRFLMEGEVSDIPGSTKDFKFEVVD
jgi:hypothetical protein